jgi:hypothetical protein
MLITQNLEFLMRVVVTLMTTVKMVVIVFILMADIQSAAGMAEDPVGITVLEVTSNQDYRE